jgi:hypothetical protein
VTQTATVKPDGTWTMDYPASAGPLKEGDNALPLVATDPAGNTSNGNLPITLDSVYKASITHNAYSDLSGVAGAAKLDAIKANDGVLNIAESRDGVTYKISFETDVNLTANNLEISGGSVMSLQRLANGNSKDWVLKLRPDVNDAGKLNVAIKTTGPDGLGALVDAAGNSITATSAIEVKYDTIAPTVTFNDKMAPSVPTTTPDGAFYIGDLSSLAGYNIGVTLPSDTQLPITSASFSNREWTTSDLQAMQVNNGTGDLFVDKSYINSVGTGIYTVSIEVTDTAGNRGFGQQLIVNDPTGILPSANYKPLDKTTWEAIGSTGNDFFINQRDGSEAGQHDTIKLGADNAKDRVFFTKTGLGTVGQPDQAEVHNFVTANDEININDLFDVSLTKSLNNYVRFETVNFDASTDGSKESTKIYVSTKGNFTDNTATTWQGQADQVIFVKDVVYDGNSNTNTLPPTWLVI